MDHYGGLFVLNWIFSKYNREAGRNSLPRCFLWDEDNNFIFFVYLHLSNLYRKLTYISVRVGYI